MSKTTIDFASHANNSLEGAITSSTLPYKSGPIAQSFIDSDDVQRLLSTPIAGSKPTLTQTEVTTLGRDITDLGISSDLLFTKLPFPGDDTIYSLTDGADIVLSRIFYQLGDSTSIFPEELNRAFDGLLKDLMSINPDKSADKARDFKDNFLEVVRHNPTILLLSHSFFQKLSTDLKQGKINLCAMVEPLANALAENNLDQAKKIANQISSIVTNTVTKLIELGYVSSSPKSHLNMAILAAQDMNGAEKFTFSGEILDNPAYVIHQVKKESSVDAITSLFNNFQTDPSIKRLSSIFNNLQNSAVKQRYLQNSPETIYTHLRSLSKIYSSSVIRSQKDLANIQEYLKVIFEELKDFMPEELKTLAPFLTEDDPKSSKVLNGIEKSVPYRPTNDQIEGFVRALETGEISSRFAPTILGANATKTRPIFKPTLLTNFSFEYKFASEIEEAERSTREIDRAIKGILDQLTNNDLTLSDEEKENLTAFLKNPEELKGITTLLSCEYDYALGSDFTLLAQYGSFLTKEQLGQYGQTHSLLKNNNHLENFANFLKENQGILKNPDSLKQAFQTNHDLINLAQNARNLQEIAQAYYEENKFQQFIAISTDPTKYASTTQITDLNQIIAGQGAYYTVEGRNSIAHTKSLMEAQAQEKMRKPSIYRPEIPIRAGTVSSPSREATTIGTLLDKNPKDALAKITDVLKGIIGGNHTTSVSYDKKVNSFTFKIDSNNTTLNLAIPQEETNALKTLNIGAHGIDPVKFVELLLLLMTKKQTAISNDSKLANFKPIINLVVKNFNAILKDADKAALLNAADENLADLRRMAQGMPRTDLKSTGFNPLASNQRT